MKLKNKTITIGGLVIIILLFLIYFLSFYYIEKSQQSIASNLQNISIYAQQENWVAAKDEVNKLEERWNRIKPLLTLNFAEADYFVLIEYLGRIKGDVGLQEKEQTITDVSAVLNVWQNLIRVIPQP